MKYIVLLCLIFLSGCDQLLRGQEQPVKQIGKDNLYFTTCSGMAETMGTCFEKAKRTCGASYAIIKQNQDSSGVHRELTFQCKK
jgi:hypothetical protein